MTNERITLQCTPETPYSKERDKAHTGTYRHWTHQRVTEVGDQQDNWPCGDLVTMKCLICGTEWEEELPQ